MSPVRTAVATNAGTPELAAPSRPPTAPSLAAIAYIMLTAGAPTPAGPEELIALVDEILRVVFVGDFAVALERAASFCRVEAAGAADLADDYDAAEPERAAALTTRALRLDTYAGELTTCAALWRRDSLT